jgi:hypothetical protein
MSDDAEQIELAEQARQGARVARMMFNAYLHEGFTEAQALALVRANIIAASGGSDA